MSDILDVRISPALRVLCYEGAKRARWPVDRMTDSDAQPGDAFIEIDHDDRGSSLVHVKADERNALADALRVPS